MALMPCVECGREISDKAAACPHCGAPVGVVETARESRAPWGCGTLLMGLVAFAVLAWGVSAIVGDNKPRRAVDTPSEGAVPEDVRAATIQKFNGAPAVRHTEWLDGDFVIAVGDNGKSWQPVADGACAWIRSQGAPAGFAVVVLEAGALSNKRWEQLARARCR